MSCTMKGGGCRTVSSEPRTKAVAPRVDIFESENEFVLLADLPGVKSDEVDIRFDKGELTILGSRERAAFKRTFAVADSVAADRIAAELKGGVLTVRLPKVEAVKPRKIAVHG